MTHSNLITPSAQRTSLRKRMLMGAGLGLLVISLFVFAAENPPAYWGKFWMIRPLIITPLAGAGAGLVHYLVNSLQARNGWQKALSILFIVLQYLVALWLGTVLGLAGTMWNQTP
jgi:FtsH-binding integral membrane protein